ncbi:peptidoglycan DD-metalloendopeptidase family protein [bacterium]|nr:peptidoglycan DD-metalloendopeptidase family protein [bacterium]
MSLKKLIRDISVYLFLAVLLITVPQISYAAPQSNTSINQKLQNNQAQIKNTRNKIQTLKVKEQQERNKLVRNQQRLESAKTNLADSENKYSSMSAKLEDMERKYQEATREFGETEALMKARIRHVFKNQRVGMFDLIFKAKDLNAMLDTLYFERIIIKRDYESIVVMKTRAIKLAKIRNDIAEQKRYLANSMNQIKSQKRSIQQEIANNENMINKLKNDRAAYERSERELARQSASLQSMLSAYSNSTVIASSSGFVKPIGGRISSPFGWRTHPIFKSRTFHSGVDIAGPNGGGIVASNSGKVIYTGWYGGYGKVVIIDHGLVGGKPTTTLYAHMSAIKVSNGQNVAKGQVIGLEGTTGYSTGPHCHFEVRINGKPNNPMNYI